MTEIADAPPPHVPDVAWPMARALILANGLGALFVFVYMGVLPSVFASSAARAAGRSLDGWVVAAVIGYLVVSGVATNMIGTRLARPISEWWARGGGPTDAERAAVLRQPLALASWIFLFWVGGAVLLAVVVAFRPNASPGAPFITAGGVALAALTVWLISFLLAERAIRPLTAVALSGADAPSGVWTLNVRTKLFLAWALGAGIPLLALAGTPLLARDAVIALDEVLVLVALAVGAVMTLNAAASVADPLTSLTEAVGRVGRGDLDVAVVVDDASEVGRLQAGFNRMVAGLKERALLEELFGRHVGIDVARRALERSAGLGGEMRDVSALFVDVVGSTAMAHVRPAGEVVEMLNALFGAVVQCAEAEGGWVNKFEGDAALVVVGAPEPCADHAARALRIAASLRQSIATLAGPYPGLDAGIGVSSGMAVAGNVGAERRYEYTVIGDPVNEAARLSDAAKDVPGRVLASSATIDASGATGATWRSAGAIALRGRIAPTLVFNPPEADA